MTVGTSPAARGSVQPTRSSPAVGSARNAISLTLCFSSSKTAIPPLSRARPNCVGSTPCEWRSSRRTPRVCSSDLHISQPAVSKAIATSLCSVAFLGTSATGSPANDEAYPAGYVSIIIQTAAGSGPDVVARLVADRLTQRWGQQVVILNRNGAAGLVAAQAAAAAQPDGYTLYMPTSTALVILPVTQPKMPVNFDKDFVPIGLISESPMIIAVSPALGVNSLGEFIALAKRKPGQILYAANNRGSFPNLAGEFFRSRAGIDLTFVPYPGAAAGLRDVMGGRVSAIIEGPSALGSAIRQGALKALAVTSET